MPRPVPSSAGSLILPHSSTRRRSRRRTYTSWGRPSCMPSHTRGEQLGAPVEPDARVVHAPLLLAPAAAEQVLHSPLHAVSQQKPSTQWPVVHTRHCASRQSAPAESSHTVPWSFRAWQVPLGPAIVVRGARRVLAARRRTIRRGAVAEVRCAARAAGFDPAPMTEQVPSTLVPPSRDRASVAVLLQTVSQHTLSTQCPLAQSGPRQPSPFAKAVRMRIRPLAGVDALGAD